MKYIFSFLNATDCYNKQIYNKQYSKPTHSNNTAIKIQQNNTKRVIECCKISRVKTRKRILGEKGEKIKNQI